MADPRDPDAAYIPADDVILRGYCGPCDYLDYDVAERGETDEPEWRPAIVNTLGMVWYEADDCSWRPVFRDRPELRFDPALAPVRDHIARVMAAGAPCHICLRAKFPDAPACATCRGSGYILPPTPIEHLMDRPGSKLMAAQSAACVAWSYRSWRVGGPVLRGVIAPYYDAIDNGWGRVDCVGAGVSVGVYPRARENGQGWRVIFHGTDDTPDIEVSGPETGPDGRACADRAALAHNFALINADGSVTTPDLPTDRSPK